jgi:uncharacterized protein YcfL
MKKLVIIFAMFLVVGCTSTKPIVDEDLFKNELNDAIQDGFPGSTYRVK